jgi:hypothetical protein
VGSAGELATGGLAGVLLSSEKLLRGVAQAWFRGALGEAADPAAQSELLSLISDKHSTHPNLHVLPLANRVNVSFFPILFAFDILLLQAKDKAMVSQLQ